MRRRRLLTATGAACFYFAGCLGIDGNDEFHDADPDSMLPPEEHVLEVLEGDWEREDADSIDEPLVDDADAATRFYRDPDDERVADLVAEDPRIETAGAATIGVWISWQADAITS